MHFRRAGTLVMNAMEIRKKLCHWVPYVFNELRDKKYLRFSIDSPSYVKAANLLNAKNCNLEGRGFIFN